MNVDKLVRKKQRAEIDNNIPNTAVACKNLGDYYHENQQYEEALECYKQEAAAYQVLGKCMENAMANRMIGEMYMLLENFDDALKHELIYLSTAVKQSNKIEEQRAYATIGRVYLTKAQSLLNTPEKKSELTKTIKSAETQFLKSLLICKSLTALPKHEVLDMTARLHLNLGLTYECKGEYNEAIKYFEKAMSICRHNDFWELLHQCYLDAGLLHFNKLNDYEKSLNMLNQAINIAERLTSHRTVRICQTLLSKSEVLIKMADFQGAKQILHKAYKLKTSDESDAEAIETNLKVVAAMCKAENALVTTENMVERKKLFEQLGDGACKLRNFTSAIGYYNKMLEAAEKNGDSGHQLVPVYVSLYQTYKDMKDYDMALQFMRKEYELSMDVAVEKFSNLMGIAETQTLAKTDFWTVDATYEEAKQIARQLTSKRKEKNVLQKQLELRLNYKMTTLADIIRSELESSRLNVSEFGEEDSNVGIETELSEELNTPDIGDDICLDDLSDSASEHEGDATEVASTSRPRTLRKRGCFTIKKNEKGESQLHRACIAGNAASVRRLIDQGHPVNVRDHAGWLPLHEAANHGFTEIVEILLDNGANLNDKGGTSCEGFTPLHDACGNGALVVVELLLNRGANAILRNDKGDTALQTLLTWREHHTLDVQDEMLYERIHDRMLKQLENAGVNTSFKESPNNDQINTKCAIKRTSRNRIISSESGSSDDDRTNYNLNNDQFQQISDTRKVSLESPPDKSNGPSTSKYCTDYRRVMSDLRKGNFQTDFPSSFKPAEKAVKKSAMLAPEEVSDDDWLDNDIAPSSKRRKYLSERSFSTETNQLSTSSKKDKNKLLGTPLNDSHVVSSTNLVLTDDSDEENVFNILMQSNQNGKRKNAPRRTSTSSSRLCGESYHMMQSSLLDSGFHRHLAASPDHKSNPSLVSSTVMSPTKIMSVTQAPVQSHSVKVQVSDLNLVIPVSMHNANDLTIEWLAVEAAKRYYSMKGVMPVLRLTTKDGAIFQNSDPISLAFAENSAISSTVLEWNMPPLAQRYMENCVQNKTTADTFIMAQIELIASTQSLTINDQILSPKQNRPLFKALHFQSNITTINLCNSFIEDEGMRHLVQALPTMKQITTLNLTGNLITAIGMKYFSDVFDAEPSNCLPELDTLILNHNPLQNQSLSSLEKICRYLTQLSILQLSSTGLTDLQGTDLQFTNLKEIDFSLNHFTSMGLMKSIDKLNACKLEKFKLSYCGPLLCKDGRNFVDAFTKTLDAGSCTNLQQVYLCGLNLNDNQCWQILQSLKRSEVLEVLSLRNNPLLTKVTWKLLIENLSLRNLYLEGCGLLLADLNDQDEEVICSVQNITFSLSDEHTIREFDLIKRIWMKMTNYTGKIFQQGQNLWLSKTPDNVSTDKWEYVYT